MTSVAELAILLGAAVVAVSLFKRLGLGSVLGYLAAGVAIGPSGLRLITNVESILHVSELGVVLLLFIIGLELRPSRLWVLRRRVFGVGGAQMLITTAALTALARSIGLPFGTSLTVGFALSLSSTAVVLQTLAERRESAHAYGSTSFGILLFQDLAVIPFLAILPVLGTSQEIVFDQAMAMALGKIALALAAVYVFGAHLARPIFRFVAKSKTHEIFTAAALLTVLGTALLMETVGLSMSLGAFLAGVVLANSEFRHEVQADIEPFEGLLLGLFFIAVGMSANVSVLAERPVAIVAVTVAVVFIKAAVLFGIGVATKHSREASLRLALALPQGGEFAFVLLGIAVTQSLLDKGAADFLVMVVTLSMAVTPLLFMVADRLARMISTKEVKREFDTLDGAATPVIIAGFGRFGQIVARMLRVKKIAFTALEVNQEQVDFVRKFGNKLYYGDASRLDLLRAASADKAKIFVLAIDDMETSVRTAELVKKHFPNLEIFARARNRQHAFALMDVGIEHVMRETLGSSIEMGEAVLEALDFTPAHAREVAKRFREHDDRSMVASHAVHHDDRKLVEMSTRYAKELESIFEHDTVE